MCGSIWYYVHQVVGFSGISIGSVWAGVLAPLQASAGSLTLTYVL